MARAPRHDAPGVAHHVMVRGIERRALFLDDDDRLELLRRLSLLMRELGFRCFAFALMANHYHLVVRSGPACISRLMARLGTGYARYFNRRHDRVGHLFQNRFRSRLVVDDADLLGLVLYVCRNPLEVPGTTAEALERTPWSSASALAGWRAPYAFEAVGETLALFGGARAEARARFRSRLAGRMEPPAGGSNPVLPDDWLPAPAPPRPTRTDADTLVREVCREFGIRESELRSPLRGPRVSPARRVVCLRAARELGLSGAEIARTVGVTPSAVSRLLVRKCPEASASQRSQ